jgi:hypothetical protein
VEDLDQQQILCSFHGLQVGVGYRVLTEANIQGSLQGHKSANGDRGELDERGPTGSQPIMQTKASDVSQYILSRGSPEEARRLVENRPELKEAYDKALAERKQLEADTAKAQGVAKTQVGEKTQGGVTAGAGKNVGIKLNSEEVGTERATSEIISRRLEDVGAEGERIQGNQQGNGEDASVTNDRLFVFWLAPALGEEGQYSETEKDISRDLSSLGYGNRRMMGSLPDTIDQKLNQKLAKRELLSFAEAEKQSEGIPGQQGMLWLLVPMLLAGIAYKEFKKRSASS